MSDPLAQSVLVDSSILDSPGIVDFATVLDNSTRTHPNTPTSPTDSEDAAAVEDEPSSRRITLTDLKKLIETDEETSEVTVEQIERVKMMHDKFMEGAAFSFNYNTMLLVASILAGLGLVSNSTATIIASMLVSPIMGPVIALGYGTTINDRKLVKLATETEVISLAFCVLIGVIMGWLLGWTELVENWPTDEMMSRCTVQNLLIGIPMAFFSGLGVAVSLLDDQTNSLVGVAISASLLPPAVNSGIMLISWHYKYDENDEVTHADWGSYASISLGLTLVNIFMIWCSSIVMFRLKEVLPIKKSVFWSDLTLARKIYQGRAILAQQAFPEENPEDRRALGMWKNVIGSLPRIKSRRDGATGAFPNDEGTEPKTKGQALWKKVQGTIKDHDYKSEDASNRV